MESYREWRRVAEMNYSDPKTLEIAWMEYVAARDAYLGTGFYPAKSFPWVVEPEEPTA